ncbi:hypothetical protein GCM10008955_37100 [Deinococcus malanensis]|uniref:Uncharacterized protein n=2 Tax=Deinococcus malanensis TaxID=1706855 RepID=A0ABQ2F3Y5_9DEIO|nr:hypothetical protein GCM10008955_37100 [Deinococcus malanensis]
MAHESEPARGVILSFWSAFWTGLKQQKTLDHARNHGEEGVWPPETWRLVRWHIELVLSSQAFFSLGWMKEVS